MEKKININYKDENGFTALHFACDEGNLKIVEIILGVDCDTNIKNIHKQTPLHISAKRGYFDISKKLIESGAELNVEDSEKNTPIHYVCKNNYIELFGGMDFLAYLCNLNSKNLKT
jgi:ankyrin repeat protein